MKAIRVTGPFLCALMCAATLAQGQDLRKIKIGYPAVSYNQIHIWVAKEAGLFRKYGLDAEVIFSVAAGWQLRHWLPAIRRLLTSAQ